MNRMRRLRESNIWWMFGCHERMLGFFFRMLGIHISLDLTVFVSMSEF